MRATPSFFLVVFTATSLLAVACGSDGGSAAADVTSPVDVAAPPDATPPVDVPAAPDLVTTDASDADVPAPPLPFRVGAAESLFRAPLGMGVSGTGPAPLPGHASPFQTVYPATNRIFSPITVKAVAVEGGHGRLVLVRLDVIGVLKEVRRAVAEELARRGIDLREDQLVVAATHTHSAPARLVNKMFWSALTDFFWPEHHDRVVAGVADTVEAALDDLEPGRFGYAFGYTDRVHSDRRCENPELMDGTMPVLRFDRADGTTKAVIVVYAVHGTIISNNDYAYSSDTGGAIEYKSEERFDSPVMVMFMNSWAGDAGVGDPRETPPEGPLAPVLEPLDRLEGVGNAAADELHAVYPTIVTTDAVDVDSMAAHIAMNQEALGYEKGEFPHLWGAVYCGGSEPEKCVGSDTPMPDPEKLVTTCVDFMSEMEGVTQTELAIGRIGTLLLPTFPGEAVTQVGRNIVEGIRAETGFEDVAFLGYANDYIGYAETEEYWYYGGYEATGATWGPKQGDYLTAESIALARHFVDRTQPLDIHAAEDFALPPVQDSQRRTWNPEPSVTVETIAEQPADEVTAPGTVHVRWTGGDPWIDQPRIWLEEEDGAGGWQPFLRQNGTPVANDAYEFVIGLEVDPRYDARLANGERTFYWWADLPTDRIQPTTTKPIRGTLRFHAQGRYATAAGEERDYDVVSEPFLVR